MAGQSTQKIIEIADIRDNVVLLNNGSLRLVMEISALNFELRSEDEQAAITNSFQNFLNSIDFPIQIVVNSQRYDINDYLQSVESVSASITNELLKMQADDYVKYIKELSTLANIMSKKFYIVVPFYLVEAPTGKGFMESLKSIFKSTKSIGAIPEEQFATYQNQLVQRAELVYDSLIGSGLRARILERDELLNMYSQLYNPGSTSQVKVDQPNA